MLVLQRWSNNTDPQREGAQVAIWSFQECTFPSVLLSPPRHQSGEAAHQATKGTFTHTHTHTERQTHTERVNFWPNLEILEKQRSICKTIFSALHGAKSIFGILWRAEGAWLVLGTESWTALHATLFCQCTHLGMVWLLLVARAFAIPECALKWQSPLGKIKPRPLEPVHLILSAAPEDPRWAKGRRRHHQRENQLGRCWALSIFIRKMSRGLISWYPLNLKEYHAGRDTIVPVPWQPWTTADKPAVNTMGLSAKEPSGKEVFSP